MPAATRRGHTEWRGCGPAQQRSHWRRGRPYREMRRSMSVNSQSVSVLLGKLRTLGRESVPSDRTKVTYVAAAVRYAICPSDRTDKRVGIVSEPSYPVVLPPPLTADIMKPIEQVTHRIYPGIEVVPVLQAAGTDAVYFSESGIPTYGISGMFVDPDLGNVHGLNERIRVQSLYDGRDFLFSLVKLYAEQVHRHRHRGRSAQ